ncbi:MAG: 50S ribosomal protein L3 [Candidatus Marinimicrobia bacterium]|nr:50S ribosomal protein L3 [Candidatus Neomarinimicrobiota bacterium]
MDSMLGIKLGMTRVFDEQGNQVPVTAIQAGPCTVVRRKTAATDGYEAVELALLPQKPQRLSKAQVGHYARHNAPPHRILREVRVAADEAVTAGQVVDAALFTGVEFVDVIGETKGRGFQGVVRRHGMAGGRASHGGKSTLRGPGSIGQREFPGRIFKNKRMSGHMGQVQITTQNLRLVQIRDADSVLLVRGSVPGPVGAVVLVRKALKKAAKES